MYSARTTKLLQEPKRFSLADKFRRDPNNKCQLPPAVILAGGLGMRLRTAYSAGPKSMAPVAGIPFLHYLLSWLSRQGVRDVVLCVGYKRSQIQKFVGRGKKWNLRVRYSVEKELLGTGGAVKKAKNLIAGGRFIVVNGDTFLDTSLIELAKLHQQRKALVTVAVVKVPKKGRYGSVHLDERGRIVSFAEKLAESAPETTANRYAVNGGVYVFEKKLLMLIRPRKRVSLETDCFPRLSRNKRVYGVVKDTYFLDIGVPDDYRRAQIELPRRVSSSYPR